MQQLERTAQKSQTRSQNLRPTCSWASMESGTRPPMALGLIGMALCSNWCLRWRLWTLYGPWRYDSFNMYSTIFNIYLDINIFKKIIIIYFLSYLLSSALNMSYMFPRWTISCWLWCSRPTWWHNAKLSSYQWKKFSPSAESRHPASHLSSVPWNNSRWCRPTPEKQTMFCGPSLCFLIYQLMCTCFLTIIGVFEDPLSYYIKQEFQSVSLNADVVNKWSMHLNLLTQYKYTWKSRV